MKAYGISRLINVAWPDRADLALYGINGYKAVSGYSAKKRKSIRRIWKKKARQLSKVIPMDY